jgi:hypothetical protein
VLVAGQAVGDPGEQILAGDILVGPDHDGGFRYLAFDLVRNAVDGTVGDSGVRQ